MNSETNMPDGLAASLDKYGMRGPTPPPTMAELEALGMQTGIAGAKEVLRIPGKRNPLRELAASYFGETAANAFFKEARDAGYELSPEQQRKYREGLNRGMASQLKNPKARIEIKIVKAHHVV